MLKQLINLGITYIYIEDKSLNDRPVVRILEEEGGYPVEPYEINLAEKLSVVVTDCDTTYKRR